ncbi:hypothetical protein FACS1894122_12260 [Alphaproteobacteria bacterium]|nr:hypothetical protein FACS1894122_12260 [Alphaproteobacteria bacterium]
MHLHIPEEFRGFDESNLTIIRGDITSENIAEEILVAKNKKRFLKNMKNCKLYWIFALMPIYITQGQDGDDKNE